MIPKDTTTSSVLSTVSNPLTKDLCPTGRHAVQCIDVEDINTKIILIAVVVWNATSERCVLYTIQGAQLRDGTPQNFWFAFGFGGDSYTNSTLNLNEQIDAAKMQGHLFAHQVELYDYITDQSDSATSSNYEVMIKHPSANGNYAIRVETEHFINCPNNKRYVEKIDGQVQVVSLCEREVSLDESELRSFINATKPQVFLWAYGEGAFSNVSMHSARNPCVARWNPGTAFPDLTENVTYCNQVDGTLGSEIRTIFDASECTNLLTIIRDRFDTGIFDDTNAPTKAPITTGPTAAPIATPTDSPSDSPIKGDNIKKVEKERDEWIAAAISFIILFIVLLIIFAVILTWYCGKQQNEKPKKTEEKEMTEIQVNDTNTAGSTETGDKSSL